MTAEANCFLCLQSPRRQRACPQALASAKYESAPFLRVINSGSRQPVWPSHLTQPAFATHGCMIVSQRVSASAALGLKELGRQGSDELAIEEVQVKRATVGIKSAGSAGQDLTTPLQSSWSFPVSLCLPPQVSQ